MNDLVIIGAGGHGRELFDTIAAINSVSPTWNVLGFVDDDPQHPDRIERLGTTVLGDVSWLESTSHAFAFGVGSPAVRRELATRLTRVGGRRAEFVHPGAYVGLDVQLGDGVVLYDRCTVTTNVQIGAHTHLNVGCAVQHDSLVGDFVQFSPGVLVNGDCIIGDDVFLGNGAIITRGCVVGTGARVGAGAVVLDDVAPGTTVVGAPARPTLR
ncbi:acetyltransferase [soil metagenome]